MLEHDTPHDEAFASKHWMTDPDVLLVHVTPFNALMWDCDGVSTRVVEHGVVVPDRRPLRRRRSPAASSSSTTSRVAVAASAATCSSARANACRSTSSAWMPSRSAASARSRTRSCRRFVARYRFFFHPARWTSLGLAVLEAMAVGVPIVGLATTELSTVIENGRNGYVDTDLEQLIAAMDELLDDPDQARSLGRGRATDRRGTFLDRSLRRRLERHVRDGDGMTPRDAPRNALVPGFFAGGFECSTHRLRDGRRLDLGMQTRHVEFADADYRRLAEHGIRVARDGFAWHRIEATPHRRDFASMVPLLKAARRHGVRVIWDLLHFGWPEGIDIFMPQFVDRFAAFARDCARLLVHESDEPPWICPINEISFLSWAGGDVAAFNPFVECRGFELKCQLVRATIAAIEAVRSVVAARRAS